MDGVGIGGEDSNAILECGGYQQKKDRMSYGIKHHTLNSIEP